MTSENQQYQALIDSYFNDTMSTVEKEAFVNELENNVQLKKEFSFQLDMHKAISDSGYDNVSAVIEDVLNPKKENQSESNRQVIMYRILKYAAVVAAILVFTVLLSRMLPPDNSSSKLASEYFEPYPAYNTFRGESNSKDLMNLAFSNYELKKYTEARANFEQLAKNEPSNMAYIFYEANALLATADFKAATPLLNKVVESENELLGDQARWYLALSLLGANNIEAAKSLLLTIKIDKNSKYNIKASELIKKLRESP